MSTAKLTVTATDAGAVGGRHTIVATLTDSAGNTVSPQSPTVVAPVTRVSDAYGNATLNLIPNAQITPANTYYTVVIDGTISYLILKTSSTETISQCLAVSPGALGSAGATMAYADNTALVNALIYGS